MQTSVLRMIAEYARVCICLRCVAHAWVNGTGSIDQIPPLKRTSVKL